MSLNPAWYLDDAHMGSVKEMNGVHGSTYSFHTTQCTYPKHTWSALHEGGGVGHIETIWWKLKEECGVIERKRQREHEDQHRAIRRRITKTGTKQGREQSSRRENKDRSER